MFNILKRLFGRKKEERKIYVPSSRYESYRSGLVSASPTTGPIVDPLWYTSPYNISTPVHESPSSFDGFDGGRSGGAGASASYEVSTPSCDTSSYSSSYDSGSSYSSCDSGSYSGGDSGGSCGGGCD